MDWWKVNNMTNYGTATIWGIDGVVRYVGMASLLGDGVINDVGFTDDFNTEYLYNKNGNATGVKVSNRQLHVEIAFTPIGSSLTRAKSMVTLLAPFSRVRLSNFPYPFSGYYNYSGGMRVTQSNTGRTLMIIPLVAFPGGASAYQMSTVIKTDV